MATTKAEIRGWLERGKDKGATHLFVVCDTFDWEDYPEFGNYANAAEAEKAASRYPRDMQKLMEVYRIDKDWEPQLNSVRSFNY
jgi:hypothetical protein